MKRIMVWDLPIRVFHWGFAICAGTALAIALLADDEGALFSRHMLLGLSACFLLIVRLVLGFIGSRHNRFGSLIYSPGDTLRYFRGVFTGTGTGYVTHNPGASGAAVGMFLVVAALVATGLGLIGEAGEEIHEILAYVLLALVAVHLAGLAVHTIRHRENIALSMVTGTKAGPAELGLRSSQPVVGGLILLIVAAWMTSLFASHDPVRRTAKLPLLGNTIQLGENEQEAPGHEAEDDD